MKKTAKKNYYLNKTHKRKQYYSIFGGMDPDPHLVPLKLGEKRFESLFKRDGKLTTKFINPEIGEGVYLKAILKLGLLLIKDNINIEQLRRINQLIDKSEIHFSFIADRPTAERKDQGVPAGPIFPHVTITVQMGPKRVKHHYGYHPTIEKLKKPEYWNQGEKNSGSGWKSILWSEVVDKTTVVDDSDDVVILLNLANCLMEEYEKTYFKELLPKEEIYIEELDIDVSKLVGNKSGNPDDIALDKIDNKTATEAVKAEYETGNPVLFSPKVFENIGAKIGMTLQDASGIARANIASIIESDDYKTKYKTIITNIESEGVIKKFNIKDIEAAIKEAYGTRGFHSSLSSARGSSSAAAASTRRDEDEETERGDEETERGDEDTKIEDRPRSRQRLETLMDQDSSTSAPVLETPMDQASSASTADLGTPRGKAPGGRSRGRHTTDVAPGTSRGANTAPLGLSRTPGVPGAMDPETRIPRAPGWQPRGRPPPGTPRAMDLGVPGAMDPETRIPRAPGWRPRGRPPGGSQPGGSLGNKKFRKSRKSRKSKKSRKSRKYKKSRKSRK